MAENVFSALKKTETTLVTADDLVKMAPAVVQETPRDQEPTRTNPSNYSVQKLAKEHTEAALQTILEIMNDKGEDGGVRLEAAKQILDRGWGKPAQSIRQEQVRITIKDVEAKLLEHKDEVDAQWDEARKLESERSGQYITADYKVLEDTPARSEGALQDHG